MSNQQNQFRYRVSIDHQLAGYVEREVVAANEGDAWAKFCEKADADVLRHPNRGERKIEKLDDE